MTRLGLLLLGLVGSAWPVSAQQTTPRFEVVSVKPVAATPLGSFRPGSRLVCPLNGCGGPGTHDPGRMTFTYISLKELIQTAYDVRPYQIEAPSWLESVRFDIVATIPLPATRDEVNLMLQNLLADRFRLKLHRSTRELPVYEMVVAKNGPKLMVAVNDPERRKGPWDHRERHAQEIRV
jgi:uncharacterized protein (TIGR03435 family)